MDYEKKYREAQKWMESIYSELSHEQQMEAEAFFPELKESEDEKMMHQLHSWMKEFGGAEEYTEKVYTWLKSLIEKQGEQEPTDKVEPKFQNGQWIVWQNKCYKVNYNGCGYELIDQNGLSTSLEYGTVDKSASAFTIQDAKDGDVLVSPPIKGQEGKEQIFIFKGINSRDYVDNCIEYYCRVYEGVFYENENGNGYMGTTSSPLYPATKEQRNILFAKMKEAGYEWNTEKKELKKISQRMVSAEANEAPEKIYLERIRILCSNEVYDNWKHQKTISDDIEYTRTDAFIEKACEFLKDRIEHDSIDYPMATKHLIEDFKIYMKGE